MTAWKWKLGIENERRKVSDVKARSRGTHFDVVVGGGGGSVMDFAKVTSILLRHGGDVRDLYGENVVSAAGIPLITVPTTLTVLQAESGAVPGTGLPCPQGEDENHHTPTP